MYPESPTSDLSVTPLIEVSALGEALAAFAAARKWDRYHSPKNLAMALSGEVGELSEIFQWLSEDASRSVAKTPETATAVRDELADVMIYLVRLANVLGVDLNDAVTQKLKKNAENYPVEKAQGNHKKYDKLKEEGN
jgi:NTP pyrophosphatase (non-canonical NTP hydrolase)